MDLYATSLAMTVAGNVGYHLMNKAISPNAHPFASLAATYAVALALSLAVLAADAPGRLGASLRQPNWASYALGIVVIGLELGFLLAYRAGWRVSAAALYSNVAVGLLLVPAGVLIFRETITTTHAAGIVLAVISLLLLSR